jgi:hypothetical protein
MRNMKNVVGRLVSMANTWSPVIDLIPAGVKPECLQWSNHNGETCLLATAPGNDARWSVWDATDGGFGSRLNDEELDQWLSGNYVNPRSATTASEVTLQMAPWSMV